MGKAARLKREARAGARTDALSRAWAEGVATVVTLTPEHFDAVRAAIEKSNMLATAIVRARHEAENLMHTAMVRAGLDPRRKYRLNPDGFVAELVVE